ncbi:phage tail protein [Ralstonia pseudosolanacearum]|uniref:phage tail protein n=1 Tax=Ralstonia pseudosolanacearum TaxID=1310165 RepID=UPI0018D1351B|nr:tail fiber protein [Ralstonia pseudosolanacearum]
MSDQFIGEIRIFGFNFAPVDWAACDGALMPISQNAALFSILGATYGGNGSTTFGLPDLRGRAVMGPVGGALNDQQGAATISLQQGEMPMHTHTAYGNNARAASTAAAGRLPARFMVAHNQSFIATEATPAPVMTTLAPQTVGPAGGSTAHENCQPYLAVNYCIALQGAWPPHP